jgi:hypothetical protein
MSDRTGVDIETVPRATAYAIRAWYTGMLSQTQAVRDDLASKVEAMKLEIQQVSSQIERTDKAIASLERVLETVDEWIRRIPTSEGRSDPSTSRPRSRRGAAEAEPEAETADEGAEAEGSRKSKGRS